MKNINVVFTCLLFISLPGHSLAEQKATIPGSTNDARIFVEMPEQTRGFMKQDMLDHLVAMNDIIALLDSGDLNALAEVAETRIGRSSMGKYRATGKGPGRYMPLEMRNIGWSMHDAASEMAELAKKGDKAGVIKALHKLTTACVVCHNSYRTR